MSSNGFTIAHLGSTNKHYVSSVPFVATPVVLGEVEVLDDLVSATTEVLEEVGSNNTEVLDDLVSDTTEVLDEVGSTGTELLEFSDMEFELE